VPTNRLRSAKSCHIFILWGDRFEEAAAVTFATEFRKAGLSVKVVGLHGPRSSGRHGLVLSSDMTLGDALALANKAVCIVIPCSATALRQIENDPRVVDFFRQAQTNQARFVVSDQKVVEKSNLKTLICDQDEVVCYSESGDLAEFVSKIAISLGSLAKGRRYGC
jgi:hypothetical protein